MKFFCKKEKEKRKRSICVHEPKQTGGIIIVSVQFGLGAHTQRGDSSFTVFSEGQEALGPVSEERGG